jgi:hypothetical protein
MAKFNTGVSFTDGSTVTGADLNNITSTLNIYTGVISEQTAMSATVSTADQLLIADTDNGDSGVANRITVQKLFSDSLTNGTYATVNLTGTITSNRTVATSATITTGTIPTLVSNNATIGTTTGTLGNFTSATITSGTITTGLIPTLTAGTTTGTAGIFTSGTIATLNSTTGTVATLNSTTGTIATLNSTTGTIATLNSTTGTIATINSTTGTITNLSTTLAGDFTITQGTGTIGTAKVTPTNLSQPFTIATAVTSTSGTAIDFTSIPSWVKRITLMFRGVSTNGTDQTWLIRIGDSGGVATTGYLGTGTRLLATSTASVASTSGFSLNVDNNAGNICHGSMTITLFDLSTNSWVASGLFSNSALGESMAVSGSKSLSATLDRVRITTSGGVNTFDAGSINIMYEG